MCHSQPGSSGTTAFQHGMCAGSLPGHRHSQETGMARMQRYQLKPNWKGLKVKPTRGMIHGVPMSVEIQFNWERSGGGNRLENAAREVYADLLHFPSVAVFQHLRCC